MASHTHSLTLNFLIWLTHDACSLSTSDKRFQRIQITKEFLIILQKTKRKNPYIILASNKNCFPKPELAKQQNLEFCFETFITWIYLPLYLYHTDVSVTNISDYAQYYVDIFWFSSSLSRLFMSPEI